ncbi:MAG TPA: GWxTD domain-containing protein [Vicinamibacteria bacterium]|nr:GWxTD domain-containing protein [Vicinamibacteria bacterium]
MTALLALSMLLVVDERVDRLPQNYREWIEKEVIYIIADKEREAFLNLESEEERAAFVTAFWQRRDPDPITPVNEFKEEHYRRLEYANKYFSRESAVPGWMTDRGKIYIILGEPADREDFTSIPMLYPTEVWFYHQDRDKSLPPLNFLFWQEHGVGPYRMFNHFLDDPEDLMPAQPMNPENSRREAYINLQEMNPSLAHAAFTLRADQGVQANIVQSDRAALDFQSLLSDIYVSPHRRVDTRYVDEAEHARGLVEADYLFNFVPNYGMANVLPGPNGSMFVHFTVEIAPRDMTLAHDPKENTYYTSVEVRAEVKTLDEKTIVHSFTKQPFVQLTESQFKDVAYRAFAYQDMFPIGEGEFVFRIVLQNQARKEYTIFESKIEVPEPGSTAPWLGDPVPLYGMAKLSPAKGTTAEPYRTYQLGPVGLDPNARRTVAIGDYLMAHVPLRNIPSEYSLSARVLPRGEGGEAVGPLREEDLRLDLLERPVVLRIPLGDIPAGHYRLAVELRDASHRAAALRSIDFDVSPLSRIHPAWAVKESIDGENEGLVAVLLADQAMRLGELERARELAERALENDPNLVPARLLLGRFELDDGRYRESIRLLEPARAQQPRNPEVLLALGDAHFQSQSFARAAELFETAAAIRRPDAPLLNALGLSHAHLGNNERAIEYLRRSIELDPTQKEIKALLARLESEAGR